MSDPVSAPTPASQPIPKGQAPRGTRDLFGVEMQRFQAVAAAARRVMPRFAFQEIATPIFEFTELFTRSLGDVTDVVSKEMYSFDDRGGESLTLRPEGTAGVVRAVLSNKLHDQTPLKFFYIGPMFRYERPQKGRYRQHHQVGVELMGTSSVEADLEVLSLGHQFLQELGLADHVTLELNSMGDLPSRQLFRAALLAYLRDHAGQLSAESLLRLERNPLRILDSKDPADHAILVDAPRLTDYLQDEAKRFWDALQNGLASLNIPWQHNPKLVRGFDYYQHTVFEFTSTHLGAQATVLGGGRYGGIAESLGGAPLPSVGFGSGIERLCLLLATPPPPPARVMVVPTEDSCVDPARQLVAQLRAAGMAVDQLYEGAVGKRLKAANKRRVAQIVLLGPDELRSERFTLRNMEDGVQQSLTLPELLAQLAIICCI
jgi:histidyl-tRNA synthetase